MNNRRPLSSEHDRHDRVLVARFAAGDAYPGETDDAKRLVDNCDDCAALAADIQLIAARTAQLPAVQRTRSFHIDAQQADKLRGSWFERVMRGFATPGWAVARPLAGAALAIGLALVVIGALPFSNLGKSANVDSAPNFSSVAGVATTLPAVTHPQPPALTAPTAEDNKNGGQAGNAPPGTMASDFGDTTASVTPGGMEITPTMPRNPVSTAQTPVDVSQGSSAPPPAATSAAPAAGATAGVAHATPIAQSTQQAYVVPTAAPTPPPVQELVGQGSVASTSIGSLDHTLLIAGGLIVAFLALLAIGLITVARRRYADPLVR